MQTHPMPALSPLARAFLNQPPTEPQALEGERRQAWCEACVEAVRRNEADVFRALTPSSSSYAADQTALGEVLLAAVKAQLPITPLLTQVAAQAPRAVRAQLTLGVLDRPSRASFATLAMLWQDDPHQRWDAMANALMRAFTQEGDAAPLVALARPHLPFASGLHRLNAAWPKQEISQQQAFWPLIQAWLATAQGEDLHSGKDAVEAVVRKGLDLASLKDDVATFTFLRQLPLPDVWGVFWAPNVLGLALNRRPMPDILAQFWEKEDPSQRYPIYKQLSGEGYSLYSALAPMGQIHTVDPALDRAAVTRVVIENTWDHADFDDLEEFYEVLNAPELANLGANLDAPTVIAYANQQVSTPNSETRGGYWATWARLISDQVLAPDVLQEQAHWLEQTVLELPRTRAAVRHHQLTHQPTPAISRRRPRS